MQHHYEDERPLAAALRRQSVMLEQPVNSVLVAKMGRDKAIDVTDAFGFAYAHASPFDSALAFSSDPHLPSRQSMLFIDSHDQLTPPLSSHSSRTSPDNGSSEVSTIESAGVATPPMPNTAHFPPPHLPTSHSSKSLNTYRRSSLTPTNDFAFSPPNLPFANGVRRPSSDRGISPSDGPFRGQAANQFRRSSSASSMRAPSLLSGSPRGTSFQEHSLPPIPTKPSRSQLKSMIVASSQPSTPTNTRASMISPPPANIHKQPSSASLRSVHQQQQLSQSRPPMPSRLTDATIQSQGRASPLVRNAPVTPSPPFVTPTDEYPPRVPTTPPKDGQSYQAQTMPSRRLPIRNNKRLSQIHPTRKEPQQYRSASTTGVPQSQSNKSGFAGWWSRVFGNSQKPTSDLSRSSFRKSDRPQ